MITEKIYELYTPDSPPYAFPRAVPSTASTATPRFQAAPDAIRADRSLFKSELRRM